MQFDFEQIVKTAVQNTLNEPVEKFYRFSTGLSLFVFDVVTASGKACVVRVIQSERRSELENGLFWQGQLESLRLPLPNILGMGKVYGYVFVVYTRLQGDDLEVAYTYLTDVERKRIAVEVADIQRKVQQLAMPEDRVYPIGALDIVRGVLKRSEYDIRKSGLFDLRYIEDVRAVIDSYRDYFEHFEPVAFLYDMNIRNVIVHKGVVTGIVDVDEVWFGDPLLSVGRGKALLLTMDQSLAFVDAWCDHWQLDTFQRRIIDVYTLLYTLRFMSTLGQTLNGNESVQTNTQNAKKFEAIAQGFLEKLI